MAKKVLMIIGTILVEMDTADKKLTSLKDFILTSKLVDYRKNWFSD